jgi:hypothetical protein
VNEVDQAERLAARYGRTSEARRRQRAFGIIGAIGVAVVLVAWIVWAGPLRTSSQFQARDLGFSIIDERQIVVQFEITVTPNTQMTCAVQALSAEYGIVGWRVVDIPPSSQRTRVFEQTLRTSEKPVTGLLYRCWVP